jgi:hypothetical protein
MVRDAGWIAPKSKLLREWSAQLKSAAMLDEADVFEREIEKASLISVMLSSVRAVAVIAFVHFCLWIMLLVLYKRYVVIQAVFFWNPVVRKWLGLGYVGILLTWVSHLRKIVLAPFRIQLISEARLDDPELAEYYQPRFLRERGGKILQADVFYGAVRAKIVVLGGSGIGKSWLMRRLAQNSVRDIAFLSADSCADGVIKAIQDKMHGEFSDSGFVSQLVYAGAIDIFIDGLNEASLSARHCISDFLESYPHTNVAIAGQPTEDWSPAEGVRQLELLPLREDHIVEFLMSRPVLANNNAGRDPQTAAKQIETFVASALASILPEETRIANLTVLSNPFDATIVAEMLAAGREPRLFRLVEQQISMALRTYREVHADAEFPLNEFSEKVYKEYAAGTESTLQSYYVASMTTFAEERIVVFLQLQEETSARSWVFRHNRYRDYFIALAMLSDKQRLGLHMRDDRFAGVYGLLATLLPKDEESALMNMIVRHTVRTNDTTVLRQFVQGMPLTRELIDSP